jgi:predicted CoA-binding protein
MNAVVIAAGRAEMNHDQYDNTYITDILKTVKIIALVGASSNKARPSYGVMAYLLSKGYRVIPVNPGQAGKQILGQTVCATLADIPEPVDMVDVFRAPEYLYTIIDQVLTLKPLPSVIWGQLEIRDDTAAAVAEAAGIKVVMNRCPAIEIPRLLAA